MTVLAIVMDHLHSVAQSSAGLASNHQTAIEGIHHQPRRLERGRPEWNQDTLHPTSQQGLDHAHKALGG